jgi:hypothetical protein
VGGRDTPGHDEESTDADAEKSCTFPSRKAPNLQSLLRRPALTLKKPLSSILMRTRQDNGMAFLRRLLPHRRVLLLAALGLLPASQALAKGPRCITARSQCPSSGMQPPGTKCACPDHPNVWGIVDMTDMEQPIYPTNGHHGREELRNDDLDDDDDSVLAGPRHHHRPDERE